MLFRLLALLSLVVSSTAAAPNERLEKVLGDRPKVEAAGHWIYNDLPKALEQGRLTGKPLLIVLRCVP